MSLVDLQTIFPQKRSIKSGLEFDSQENTDDHLMHIVGLAKDAKGRAYFIIKNSWGQGNAFGGRQFVSMPYFRHHTIGIMLHEDGLSKTDNKAMGR